MQERVRKTGKIQEIIDNGEIRSMIMQLYQKPQKSRMDFYKTSSYNSRQTMQNST